MDKDLKIFLKNHIEDGFFDRTLLILMGDHGRRGGGSFTSSRAGWVDANTPLLYIRAPPQLKRENPDITRILNQNKDKLTTMQDLFKTMTDPVITRVAKPLNYGQPREQEGLSLLQPLPSRTCEEALVPDKFCTCPGEKIKIDTNDPEMVEYAEKIVSKIVETSKVFPMCQNLNLHHIEWGWATKTVYHLQIVTFLNKTNVPKYNRTKVTVNCGAHRESYCSACPKGRGKNYCNGDCVWEAKKKECVLNKDKVSSELKDSTSEPQDYIQFYEDIFMYAHKTKEDFEQMVNASTLATSPAYSVLILALDSTSKSAFLRNMPLTTAYLEQQGAVRFNHHHRQGENSYPNIMPLLSGRRIIYEENAKDGFDKGYMDDIAATNNMSWAWEPWAKLGLPTMHFEDMAWAGVYNYHYKKGWKTRPFMFFLRKVFDAMKDWKIRNNPLMNGCYLCVNNSPLHKRELSFLSNFIRSYNPVPYISFIHLAEYSHDQNNFISYMDKDLKIFLKNHIEDGLFDRTLLILMGDHGRRGGGSFTSSRAGWVDANTPLLYIRAPPQLKRENPDITRILNQSKDKLTTMQDLFKTMTDPVITRVEKPLNYGLPREQEGLSLLQPLPSRTCEEALVPDKFCTCPGEKIKIDTNDPEMVKYAEKIVSKIVETSKVFPLCQNLNLHHIEWGWATKTVYHLQIVTFINKTNVPKYNRTKVTVNCGAHRDKNCSACPKGRGKTYCNGDCIWEVKKKECVLNKDKVSSELRDNHIDDLPKFHAVFDSKTWPKVEITRSDWYSTTSGCVTDEALDSIRPFCICPT